MHSSPDKVRYRMQARHKSNGHEGLSCEPHAAMRKSSRAADTADQSRRCAVQHTATASHKQESAATRPTDPRPAPPQTPSARRRSSSRRAGKAPAEPGRPHTRARGPRHCGRVQLEARECAAARCSDVWWWGVAIAVGSAPERGVEERAEARVIWKLPTGSDLWIVETTVMYDCSAIIGFCEPPPGGRNCRNIYR